MLAHAQAKSHSTLQEALEVADKMGAYRWGQEARRLLEWIFMGNAVQYQAWVSFLMESCTARLCGAPAGLRQVWWVPQQPAAAVMGAFSLRNGDKRHANVAVAQMMCRLFAVVHAPTQRTCGIAC